MRFIEFVNTADHPTLVNVSQIKFIVGVPGRTVIDCGGDDRYHTNEPFDDLVKRIQETTNRPQTVQFGDPH